MKELPIVCMSEAICYYLPSYWVNIATYSKYIKTLFLSPSQKKADALSAKKEKEKTSLSMLLLTDLKLSKNIL